MKKVSLMIAALALVLGLSQCKKQEEPAANGQKQHIVLTADNGNDGSKVSADFVSANLNLTWDGDEVITVSGGAKGTLDKITVDESNPSNATFEGDIEIIDESKPFEFTVGGTPNYEGQPGTEDGCEAWIRDNISLIGTDGYDPQGQYSADMKLPYAVLKLDVSALGTTGELEIKVGGTKVASVTDVSTPKAVFVAVPADGNEKEYKISIGDKTATKKWPLLPNTFYTKSNGTGGGTGQAIVIEPTTPKFTVGMDGDKPITVEFAPGNLYYDADDNGCHWKFESNQWDYRTYEGESSCINGSVTTNGTPSGDWGLFGWSGSTGAAYGMSISLNGTDYGGDFKDWGSNAIGSDAANTWRTLSKAEWDYLLNTRASASASDFREWKELDNGTHKGLVILPDGTKNPSTVLSSITSTSDLATHDAVFLPAAGNRSSKRANNVGTLGYYWSNTPNETVKAYRVYFNNSATNSMASGSRESGSAVRLVRDVK